MNEKELEIKEIKAYKTSNGEIFEKKKEAQDHQMYIIGIEKLEELIIHNATYDMSKDDIKDFILEHKENLLEILRLLLRE